MLVLIAPNEAELLREVFEPVTYDPIATQSLADTHEMPVSSLDEAPLSAAGVWSDHALPFQRSISASAVPAELS